MNVLCAGVCGWQRERDGERGLWGGGGAGGASCVGVQEEGGWEIVFFLFLWIQYCVGCHYVSIFVSGLCSLNLNWEIPPPPPEQTKQKEEKKEKKTATTTSNNISNTVRISVPCLPRSCGFPLMLTVDSVIFWLCYVWCASSERLAVSNLAGVVIVCVNVWRAVQIDSGCGVKVWSPFILLLVVLATGGVGGGLSTGSIHEFPMAAVRGYQPPDAHSQRQQRGTSAHAWHVDVESTQTTHRSSGRLTNFGEVKAWDFIVGNTKALGTCVNFSSYVMCWCGITQTTHCSSGKLTNFGEVRAWNISVGNMKALGTCVNLPHV